MADEDDARGASLAPVLTEQRVVGLLLDHARDYAIFTLDLDGRITSWTPGAERVTGYPADEAVGMDFAVMFTPSDRAAGQPQLEVERAWREGRSEDSRWHLCKSGARFWANGLTFRAPEVHGLVKVMRDETTARLAEEQRVLLLNELNHRINNTLVTVQSLVEQTLRGAGVDRRVAEDVTDRLRALSAAHASLVEQNWAGAELSDIVERALTPFRLEGGAAIAADGPSVRVSPQQAVSMSLALHELATNAVKYGALSRPEGAVEVSWNLYLDEAGARHITFLWAESGGPPVSRPIRRGFGTRLIARSFAKASGGKATIDFAPEGVRCILELTLSEPAELLGVGGEA
jgi:PAS domain S-box-containing protein